MSVSADTLRLHLRYTAWASRRLVEAASQLSEEELTRDFRHADKSVLGTLVHVFAADRVWLGRIQGNVPARFIDLERDMKMSVLESDWPALHERWMKWADGQSDESVRGSFHYRDLKGNAYSSSVWQTILHVVNHGTHHRGQVSAMLRAMGHAPPAVDLIAFYRQLNSGS